MASSPRSNRTWAEWFGIDEKSRAESRAKKEADKARKEAEAEAKRKEAVAELRALFDNDAGRLNCERLAQGGEFGRFGKPEDALSDKYLRRWLVARDWHVQTTYDLLMAHGEWRSRHTPKGYIEDDRVQRPLDDDKTFLQGADYEGRGVVIVRVRNHFSTKRDLRQMRLFSAYIIEAVVALCDTEKNPDQRVVCMFDMTDCSRANMDVPCMHTILGLLSNHYVERLSAMYFFNPPRLFHILWNASKHLVPEVTSRKIKMIDPTDLKDLQACVPPDVLPVEYGGKAPLRPIGEARKHFKLPPWDGRDLGTDAPTPALETEASGDLEKELERDLPPDAIVGVADAEGEVVTSDPDGDAKPAAAATATAVAARAVA